MGGQGGGFGAAALAGAGGAGVAVIGPRRAAAVSVAVAAGPRAGTSEEALAELYRTHYERLLRTAHAILGSEQAAEDAVQDAYVEVWRRLGAVRNPAGYLRRAVVNRSTSMIRRRIVEQRHARPDREVAVDGAIEGGIEHDAMKNALMQLAPRYRAALVLRFYEDLPDEEIAAALGVRRATVRSMVHRGVQQLRDMVD